MDKQLLDIYSDYLICSFGLTTATGLSNLLEGAISHDQITRFLSRAALASAYRELQNLKGETMPA